MQQFICSILHIIRTNIKNWCFKGIIIIRVILFMNKWYTTVKLIDDLSFEIIYQMFFINELSLNNKSPIYGMKDETLNLLMAFNLFSYFSNNPIHSANSTWYQAIWSFIKWKLNDLSCLHSYFYQYSFIWSKSALMTSTYLNYFYRKD